MFITSKHLFSIQFPRQRAYSMEGLFIFPQALTICDMSLYSIIETLFLCLLPLRSSEVLSFTTELISLKIKNLVVSLLRT